MLTAAFVPIGIPIVCLLALLLCVTIVFVMSLSSHVVIVVCVSRKQFFGNFFCFLLLGSMILHS